MAERIICTYNQYIAIIENGECRRVSSDFIEHYCANHEQIIRKNAWKMNGVGARFRLEQPGMSHDQARFIFENAQITGIAPSGNDEIVFSVSVGDSSGMFRRPLCECGPDSEGHLIHDHGILIQDVTTSRDGRMAFSIRNKHGEHNIAVTPPNSAHYREITEGDSIDRNPFWDPLDADSIIYDSAPLAFGDRNNAIAGSRGVMRLYLKNGEITEIVGDDKHDYMSPQADGDGNTWCIRRPYRAQRGMSISPLDLIGMPFKIGRALFGALQMFTLRNTGEPLISSGMNPAKMPPTPKEMLFEGKRIDGERALRRNMKSGDSFPGYIPRNWELIRIDKEGFMHVQARGVCAFAVRSTDEYYYSNGKYIFKSNKGELANIAETVLPTKIVIM
jgi:hypothetical protein